MLRFRPFGALLLFSMLSVACDQRQLYVPYDDDAGVSDGGSDGSAGDASAGVSVYLAGTSPVIVPAGADVVVSFVVVSADETPVPDASVSFAIDGTAADSSLDLTKAKTSADGTVEVTVRGGLLPTTFQLRAVFDGLAPQYVTVKVAGGLSVSTGT